MAPKPKKLIFIKMQGTGNDQILVDCTKNGFPNAQRVAKKIANRKYGVGSDQVLFLYKSRKADFRLQIFNADGSEAEMCGNGIRCAGRYIREEGLSQKRELKIETLAGMRDIKIGSKSILVNLGEPKLKGKEIPVNLSGRIINRPLKIENKEFRITCLSLGNPHCVIFQESLDHFPVERFGPLLENYHLFPRRINVSFVNVATPADLKVRVWERGAGETLSCGTAAAAALVASVLNGFSERKAKVELPGGKLEIEWSRETNCVWLTGPAEKVFEGSILI